MAGRPCLRQFAARLAEQALLELRLLLSEHLRCTGCLTCAISSGRAPRTRRILCSGLMRSISSARAKIRRRPGIRAGPASTPSEKHAMSDGLDISSEQIAPVPRISLHAFCDSPETAQIIQEALGRPPHGTRRMSMSIWAARSPRSKPIASRDAQCHRARYDGEAASDLLEHLDSSRRILRRRDQGRRRRTHRTTSFSTAI